MIQAAAALYQWERGVPSGAEGLYRTSVVYLKKYAPAALGLNVEKLVSALERFFKQPKKETVPVVEYEK